MKIPYADLNRLHEPLKNDFLNAFNETVNNSNFIGSFDFEKDFKEFVGAEHALGCNSGTDALYIAIKSLELPKHSKIAVPAISYAATAMSVLNAGHEPVFIDVDKDTGLIQWDKVYEMKENLQCVIPVHIYGQCCHIPDDLGIPIIEDCAQAHCSYFHDTNKHVGTKGVIGCFSFYPGKNLGALGDAGICITNDSTIYEKMLNYGRLGADKNNRYNHITDGINSRMDNIQSKMLSIKLKHIHEWTNERQKIGDIYIKNGLGAKRETRFGSDVFHVFHLVIENREEFIKNMNDNGISTNIHYPIALNKLKCFNSKQTCPNAEYLAKHCVSIPLFNHMTDDEIDYVIRLTCRLQAR